MYVVILKIPFVIFSPWVSHMTVAWPWIPTVTCFVRNRVNLINLKGAQENTESAISRGSEKGGAFVHAIFDFTIKKNCWNDSQ